MVLEGFGVRGVMKKLNQAITCSRLLALTSHRQDLEPLIFDGALSLAHLSLPGRIHSYFEGCGKTDVAIVRRGESNRDHF